MIKKIFSAAALAMIFIVTAIMGMAVKAPGVSALPENYLVSEDFEGGTPGADVSGWNGWTLAQGSTDYILDSSITVTADPIDAGNKACGIYRWGSSSQSRQYLIAKSLAAPITSGYISISFKVMADSNFPYSDKFQIYILDSAPKGWDINFGFLDSRISSRAKNMGFRPNAEGTVAARGEWFDFEILLDLDGVEGGYEEEDPRNAKRARFTIMESGIQLAPAQEAPWHDSGTDHYYFNNGSFQSIRIGSNRQEGARVLDGSTNTPQAQFYFDDLVIKTLTSDEVDCMKKAEELRGLFESELENDVSLPEADGGISISWESNSPNVITNEGVITRGWGKTGKAEITATITKGSAVLQRTYTVLVKPSLSPYSIMRLVWDGSADSVVNGIMVRKNTQAVYGDVKVLTAVYNKNSGQKDLTDVRLHDVGVFQSGVPLTFAAPMEMKDGEILNAYVWSMAEIAPLSPKYEFGSSLYYVSPNGLDSNPGTLEAPWKSMRKAASALKPGDTAIFEDGVYYEEGATVFGSSGDEGAPITIKARNRHQAVIVYPESLKLTSKTRITSGQKYINIQNFEFTQVAAAEPTETNPNPTSDILLTCLGKHCSIVGNKFYNVYEEGIKVTAAHDILVNGNIIIGSRHEGIDMFNTSESVLMNNEVINAGRVGIMVKGNSRNSLIYNNYVYNDTTSMSTAGFTVGGVSNNTSPHDVAADTGYEAYNCIFYNNIVYSATAGLIPSGISYYGAKDCHSYNNIIIGTREGFTFREPNGITNGWGWDPPNVTPVLKNNILMSCTTAYSFVKQPVGGVISDYNLFYNITNAGSIPSEPHSKYEDPLFVDSSGDWRLMANSPAIEGGTPIPQEIDGFEGFAALEGAVSGRKLNIALVDYTGAPRVMPWDIGAYNHRQGSLLAEETFEGYDPGNDTRDAGPVDAAGKTLDDPEFVGPYASNVASDGKGFNGDVIGYNGWVIGATSAHTNNSTFKIIDEPGVPGNKIGEYKRLDITQNSSSHFMVRKNFTDKSTGNLVSVSSGLLKLRFKVFRTGNANIFQLRPANGSNSYEFMNIYANGTVACTGSGLYDSISIGAIAANQWYEFELLFDFENRTITLNHYNSSGTRLSSNVLKKGTKNSFIDDSASMNYTQLTGFDIGMNRTAGITAGAVGMFYFDDIYATLLPPLESQ